MKIELVSIHFWIIHILIIFGFIGGIFYKVSNILKGSLIIDGKTLISSRWSKFWFLMRKFFRNIFSKKIGPILAILILDSIIHVKLFRDNKLKWFAHTCLFWGLAALFILSVLSGIAVEMVPAFGYEEGSCGFIDALADKDFWGTALLNEWLNIIILFGIILAFVRGFITKKSKGLFMFQDIFLIIFIILILVSGWLTESTRYIIEHTPRYIARMGYLGYYLSRFFQFAFRQVSEPGWAVSYRIFWHIHVSIVWMLFLYIPFSKLSHILFSPLASILNVFEKRKHTGDQY